MHSNRDKHNVFQSVGNTFRFHSFCFWIFVFLVIGNEAKTKICMNLVKNFYGTGSHYNEIERLVKQIKPSPTIEKIEGKIFSISNCIELNRFN